MADIVRNQTEEPPGPALAATLGLIVLGFLPLVDGGYSGTGFQIGFVLLPISAAIGWGVCSNRSKPAVLVLLLFLLSGLLCFGWIQQGRLLWYYMLHIPAAWICTWVLFNQVPGRSKHFFSVITVSAVLTCFYGWFLWVGRGTVGYQITSTFGLHNAYAGFLLLAWPTALIGFIRSQGRSAKLAYGLAVLLLCATLVLTYSRASWVFFACQLVLIGWVAMSGRLSRKAITPYLGYLGVAVGTALAGLLTLAPVRESIAQVGNFSGYSMQGRFRFWGAALEIFRDHPLWGVGPGNFAYVYPQYQQDFIYYSVDPHSWPLQLLCELGLVGILVGLLVIGGLLIWVRRLWTATAGLEKVVLVAAIGGSLGHAAVDFDYTFGATTALLGALLAYGSFRSQQNLPVPADIPQIGLRLASGGITFLLILAAVFGEALTAERFNLDRLRDAQLSMPLDQRVELLEQCIRYNPLNHTTRYHLASVIAYTGSREFGSTADKPLDKEQRDEAIVQLDAAIRLNPRFPRALALKGLLIRPPWEGEKYLEQALELDPYNFPDHYYYYAGQSSDDETRYQRLIAGMEAIPAHDPIKPDHVRPTWHELNPMFMQWWLTLSELAEDEDEASLYRKRYVRFKVYLDNQARSTNNSDLLNL